MLHHSGKKGLIRYRQIESHLMPLMAYLIVDNPGGPDPCRVCATGAGGVAGRPRVAPLFRATSRGFRRALLLRPLLEQQDGDRLGTRFMCSGRVFTMVGDGSPGSSSIAKTDLEQFRHEYFLLFLIPHFHRAALLMLQDRLVDATNPLDVGNAESVRQFRRVIRQTLG